MWFSRKARYFIYKTFTRKGKFSKISVLIVVPTLVLILSTLVHPLLPCSGGLAIRGKNVTFRPENWAELTTRGPVRIFYERRKHASIIQHVQKCRGKRDTIHTRNIPRCVSFSLLHFVLYLGKSFSFRRVQHSVSTVLSNIYCLLYNWT